MMAPMMPLYNAGQLAAIHRIGYINQSRSHFDSQDYWEKGVPRNPSINDGMFYRQLREMLDLTDPNNSFAAASIDGTAFTALKGETPFPNFHLLEPVRLPRQCQPARQVPRPAPECGRCRGRRGDARALR